MKRIDEALRDLGELATDGAEETTATQSSTDGTTGMIRRLRSEAYSLHVLCEALIDLGAAMGLWSSDMIRVACDNIVEFDRLPGDSREIIAERQRALRRLLKDEIKRPGSIRHGHL